MADTDTETQPLPNGNAALNEEEEERMKQRPADIDADVREMERRKRVEALMSSKLFREELERVLDQQMHEGGDAPLLQRIREMVGGKMHAASFRGPSCVLPINDIRGIEGVGYEKGEKILRCKLAALYRLVDLFGWTQSGMQGQITGRLNIAEESMLTAPRGLLPHEVTASSLVKVDMQGNVQDQGTTNFPVNVEGLSWVGCVHAARPDVRCVVQVRAGPVLAASCTRALLPLSHEAALLGPVAYHTMPYGNLDNAERDKLVRALGPSSKVLVLSGSGALCCGSTVEEAFHLARCLVTACDLHMKLISVPQEHLQLIDPQTAQQMYEASLKPPPEGGKWRVGGEEFEALMRMLDNAGYRTGYIYRHPLVKNDVPRPKNDVELPPAVSSLGYLLEEEELYRQGIWKKGHGKTGERTRWLNSPNVYQKVEVLETGTNDPKKITKWVDANNEEWVQDGSPKHSSTPVKIDTLQFVPKNTNPKEFKALQQQIKDNRRADKISAGPVSHILEGVTWDEAGRLMAEDAHNTHTGDHVVLMGAASKGIIQRDYQHNATMYSAPYARNPFEHVTDSDIAHYRDIVHRRHNNQYDTDVSESEAISAAQVTSPASATETEDESRDEHRVLRIETKQVPVRSQPEVVLSDVDTTDNFLNVERAHAERTKGTKISPEAKARLEALTVNKKNKHDYTRTDNFDKTIKKFESPDNSTDSKKTPRCKVSLNTRINDSVKDNAIAVYNSELVSSRSSLYSIPSIEWDAKFKPEYALRTQSLPRTKKVDNSRLYRTRSHSGFINTFIKDPEPNHFHIPKCKVCGSNNNTYAWQLSLDRHKRKCRTQRFYSVDNLPQKCIEEFKIEPLQIKIQETVFKVETNEAEFVDSQEFSEDNYISDYSTDHQTVIERQSPKTSKYDFPKDMSEETAKNNEEKTTDEVLYKAVLVNTNDADKITQADDGEYHSFSDDMDFETSVYESPVKDLVEKDIRDYSVPINFYCDDYSKRADSPRKSPQKRRESLKTNFLEPILEESKSSTGEESTISYNDINFTKYDNDDNLINSIMISELVDNIVHDVPDKSNARREQNVDKLTDNLNEKAEIDLDKDANIPFTTVTAINEIIDDCVFEKVAIIDIPEAVTVMCTYAEETHFDSLTKTRVSSIEFNSLSSTSAVHSLDSTAEFEKYEVIADIISYIIRRIDFADASYNNTENVQPVSDLNMINVKEQEVIKDDVSLVCTTVIPQYEAPSQDSQLSDEGSVAEFSIAIMVTEIDTKANVINDTILTESTESETSFNYKIIESVVYYVFDRVFVCLAEKNRRNRKKSVKKVVTIVDAEDILFTSNMLWEQVDLLNKFENADNKGNNVEVISPNSDFMNIQFQENIDAKSDHETAIIVEECLNSEVERTDYEVLFLKPEELQMDQRHSTYKKHSYIQEYDDDEGVFSADIIPNDMNEYTDFIDLNKTRERLDLDDTLEVACDIISDLLERSVIDVECSLTCELCVNEEIEADMERLSNETFVLDPPEHEEMNTAFVEDDNYLNRASSPKRGTTFEACTESPIKKNTIAPEIDVYEKEESIFASPFLKKAPVISMSQTEQPGGVKYWLSFDESLQEFIEKPAPRYSKKYEENKIPSFVTFKTENEYIGKEKDKRRSSVLLDDYTPTNNDNIVDVTINSSFTEYNTCESDQINVKLDESCQRRLIYDSRTDLHRGRSSRKYNSWPPFEDTLFYRIISKFRMSESFDPSDFETSRGDVSY